MTKPCDCPLAGYCERHEIYKTATWQRLCSTRDDYRRAWDSGRGPGQPERPETDADKQERKQRIEKRVKQNASLKRAIRLIKAPTEGLGDAAVRLLDQAQRSNRIELAAKLRRLIQCASCNQGRAVALLNSESTGHQSG